MYADGYVEYHGHAHVIPIEPELRTAQFDAAKQAAIADAFTHSGFASFDNGSFACPSEDLGSLIEIKYRDHDVSFFDMCSAVPDDARLLVGELLDLLDLRDWWSGYYPKPLHLEPRE